MDQGFITLLRERRFLPLFITQFFGAFNDNAYKLAMLTLISYSLTHSQAQSEYYQAMAGGLFIIPFFLFSATAGQLTDKYDKALIARLCKVFELFLMLLGGVAFYSQSIFLMMSILTGMGIHSAFFGPMKYAILPDHLPKRSLLAATGLVEASTFIAILLGTTFGTMTIGDHQGIPYLAIIITITAAFLGLIASLFIPPAPSYLEDLKVDYWVFQSTFDMLRQAHRSPRILLSILTISWFWLVGAIILTKLPDYTHYVLGANPSIFALFLALFSVGIALGSLMINALQRGRITLRWVPLCMILFSIFTFDLYLASPDARNTESLIDFLNFFTWVSHWRITVDLFLLSFCAGLFTVPLYTFIQIASEPEHRARTIAANNIYNALFMVLGTLVVMILIKLSCSIPQVFFVLSILNAIVALILWVVLRRTIHIHPQDAPLPE